MVRFSTIADAMRGFVTKRRVLGEVCSVQDLKDAEAELRVKGNIPEADFLGTLASGTLPYRLTPFGEHYDSRPRPTVIPSLRGAQGLTLGRATRQTRAAPFDEVQLAARSIPFKVECTGYSHRPTIEMARLLCDGAVGLMVEVSFPPPGDGTYEDVRTLIATPGLGGIYLANCSTDILPEAAAWGTVQYAWFRGASDQVENAIGELSTSHLGAKLQEFHFGWFNERSGSGGAPISLGSIDFRPSTVRNLELLQLLQCGGLKGTLPPSLKRLRIAEVWPEGLTRASFEGKKLERVVLGQVSAEKVAHFPAVGSFYLGASDLPELRGEIDTPIDDLYICYDRKAGKPVRKRWLRERFPNATRIHWAGCGASPFFPRGPRVI